MFHQEVQLVMQIVICDDDDHEDELSDTDTEEIASKRRFNGAAIYKTKYQQSNSESCTTFEPPSTVSGNSKESNKTIQSCSKKLRTVSSYACHVNY